MKLLSIFVMIAATMLVNTEAVKIQAQIDAPQQEVGSILELAEVEKRSNKGRANEIPATSSSSNSGGHLVQTSSTGSGSTGYNCS